MKYNGLPVFEAKITSEDDGIVAISLVDYPAVEKDFVCFKKNEKIQKFSIDNEEERLITGVVMLADTPIYRVGNSGFEYYITFNRETIKQMASKMLKDGTFMNNDLQHDGNMVEGFELVELYIKDEKKGINPNFVEVPDGSLMATYHVIDDAMWEEVKNGNYLNGFSLEGYFDVVETENYNKINKNKTMKIIEKLMKSLVKFTEIATDKGTLLIQEGEELAVGVDVYVESEGEWIAAEDGEYAYDEKVIVVADGKIADIKDPEAIEEPTVSEEFSKICAEKFESYEEREMKVYEAVRDQKGINGWLVEAGDDYAVICIWTGDVEKNYRYPYTIAEDGAITVGDGEEVKLEAEFVPVEEPAKVEEAIETQVEMAEEAPVEEPVVEPTPEERDDKQEQIDALKGEIADLKADIESLRNAIAEIVQQPVVEPIVEEFSKIKDADTKGISGGQKKAAKLFASLKK